MGFFLSCPTHLGTETRAKESHLRLPSWLGHLNFACRIIPAGWGSACYSTASTVGRKEPNHSAQITRADLGNGGGRQLWKKSTKQEQQ